MIILITNKAKALSTFSCNNTDICIPSGSAVTCTCSVEDGTGGGSTLWSGTAFISQCDGTLNQILLSHPQFSLRVSAGCGDRISAIPVSQESPNYTSNVTITVDTSNNGSSVNYRLAGQSAPVGMKILMVGAIPPAASTLSVSSLTMGNLSLRWMEPTNVFGGIGSYRVTVRSDQPGDIGRLCGTMTASNGEAAPVREFTNWKTEGQTCYYSVRIVAGDNCNLESTLSQEILITLQGPNQTMVERFILDNPTYIDNQLRVIDISFVYMQETPVMIINGVTSITTHFSITYSYSTSGSCTTIVPLSCDQQHWCNYTLNLDNCPTQTPGDGMFSVVPLNTIGSGNPVNSNMIANKNPLFTVVNQADSNFPSNISLQLTFQRTFISARCDLTYGLGADCNNLNLNKSVSETNGDAVFVNFTLTSNGMYCYRVSCSVTPPSTMFLTPIAQGSINYQSGGGGGGGGGGGAITQFPPWGISVIIIIVVLVILVILGVAAMVFVKKQWNRDGPSLFSHSETKLSDASLDGQGRKEEFGISVYEEISQPEVYNENFEMGDNVAYGPVVSQGRAN